MRYINKDDLIEIIQEKFLDDSLQLDDEILNGIENKAIALASSYISGRYKVDDIFCDPVMRHPVLLQVIAMLVVYRSVRRNAARKVPDDYVEIYREAKEILKNIQSGTQSLEPLPEIKGDDGKTASLMYGNSTNDNYFI